MWLGAEAAASAAARIGYFAIRAGSEGLMLLARVVGTVVATRKDPRLEGKRLLIVKPISPQGTDEPGYLVAVDTVDAGARETVLIVQGSSARMAAECKDRPVDASIVGIVDIVRLDEEETVAATVKSKK